MLLWADAVMLTVRRYTASLNLFFEPALILLIEDLEQCVDSSSWVGNSGIERKDTHPLYYHNHHSCHLNSSTSRRHQFCQNSQHDHDYPLRALGICSPWFFGHTGYQTTGQADCARRGARPKCRFLEVVTRGAQGFERCQRCAQHYPSTHAFRKADYM